MTDKYQIIVLNKQGASVEHHARTRFAAERWLKSAWHDPEQLSVRIYCDGLEVGCKAFGLKRIAWQKAGSANGR